MNLIPVKTPRWVKKLFPNYVWDIKTEEKILYLTFDDGPTPEITSWTLDILNEFNAKASFFCLGNNVQNHPEIFRRICTEGHRIGNHTFNHPRGWYTKTDVYISEVQRTQEIIDSKMEDQAPNPEISSVHMFRPPYGQITPNQGKSLIARDFKIIMWDVLSFDWMDVVSPEKCYHNVISKATNGSIIVFHDSVKASENMQYALPKVLEFFSKKGFVFKSIA